MKKIISFFMIIVILSGFYIPVYAGNENDGYAYGSYSYGGRLVFNSFVQIYNLENVRKLTICADYNPSKLKPSDIQAPDYFNISEKHFDGRLILTVSEGNGIYEDEKFYINFDVLDEDFTEKECSFSVSVKAEFRDGTSRNLKIPCNLELYLQEPEIILPSEDEFRISCDKKFYVLGEAVTFTIPVEEFPESEKTKIVFGFNKDVLALRGIIADKAVTYTEEKTQDGFFLIFDRCENMNGGVRVVFDVKGKGKPDFFINSLKITQTGEDYIMTGCNTPVNYVYERNEIAEIILSDKFECYREEDILYLPFTVTEKDFEGQITSNIGEYGADLGKRFASSGYTDRPVVSGEEIVARTGGEVSDRIKICIIGDTNCNGKVTAADARLALRHSARLENLTDISFLSSDADRNGKISSADARKILRVSAGIDKF